MCRASARARRPTSSPRSSSAFASSRGPRSAAPLRASSPTSSPDRPERSSSDPRRLIVGFTFINTFEIETDVIDVFCEQWKERSRFMRTSAGFISATLYRARTAETRFQLINVAKWTSEQAFTDATANPAYREELDQLFADIGDRMVANRRRYDVYAHFDGDAITAPETNAR